MPTERLKQKRKSRLETEFKQLDNNGRAAGLARTQRIIRIEKEKELQFMKLCHKIKLEDFRETRSENQKENRIAKRGKLL